MATRAWSEHYDSGVAKIDAQHKNMFNMINKLEEEYDNNMPYSFAASFLEIFLHCVDEHYKAEEEIMEKSDYPLTALHKKIHSKARISMKRLLLRLKEHKVTKPYQELLDIGTACQNHIVKDDLTIFYYGKYKNSQIGNELADKQCEIFNLENRLLGMGKITLFQEGGILITCNNEHLPTRAGSVLKITVIMPNRDSCQFVARVQKKVGASLQLSRGAIINTANDRDFYRVATRLSALLCVEGAEPVKIEVINISAGGLLIETDCVLAPETKASVSFELQDFHFTEQCKVVRAFKKDALRYNYGMEFLITNNDAHNKLTKYLLRLQIKHNWSMI